MSVPSWEDWRRAVYWLVWPGACLYAVLQLYWTLRLVNLPGAPLHEQEEAGGGGGGSWYYSDNTLDTELYVVFVQRAPLLVMFSLAQLFVDWRLRVTGLWAWLPVWHAVVGVAFLMCSVGGRGLLLMVVVVLVYYPVARFVSRFWAWLVLMSVMCGRDQLMQLSGVVWNRVYCQMIAVCARYEHHDHDEDDSAVYTGVVLMWCLCRLLMMTDLRQLPSPPASSSSSSAGVPLSVYCGFALYTPTLSGPLVQFDQYATAVMSLGEFDDHRQPRRHQPRHHVTTGLIPLTPRAVAGRCSLLLLCYAVLTASNRLVNFHALALGCWRESAAGSVGCDDDPLMGNRWAWSGLVYWSGQYFHVKYVLIYGLGALLAECDGVAAPALPRCVAIVTSYAQMWKHFDAGLYSFMRDHIYVPLCGALQRRAVAPAVARLTALSVVFGFVFVWHGGTRLLWHWTLANWALLLLERALVTRMVRGPLQQQQRRYVAALLYAPLFMLSMACQTGFLCDSESLGQWALRHALLPPSLSSLLAPIVCCFSACLISFDVDRWRETRG